MQVLFIAFFGVECSGLNATLFPTLTEGGFPGSNIFPYLLQGTTLCGCHSCQSCLTYTPECPNQFLAMV